MYAVYHGEELRCASNLTVELKSQPLGCDHGCRLGQKITYASGSLRRWRPSLVGGAYRRWHSTEPWEWITQHVCAHASDRPVPEDPLRRLFGGHIYDKPNTGTDKAVGNDFQV